MDPYLPELNKIEEELRRLNETDKLNALLIVKASESDIVDGLSKQTIIENAKSIIKETLKHQTNKFVYDLLGEYKLIEHPDGTFTLQSINNI